jgi:hypothetical protein
MAISQYKISRSNSVDTIDARHVFKSSADRGAPTAARRLPGGVGFKSSAGLRSTRASPPSSPLPRAFMRAMVYWAHMAKAADRIIELFRTLPARDQRTLVDQLSETARGASFYERMTAEQRAELDDAIDEVDRGETISAEGVFNDIAQRFGFSNA